MKVRTRYTECDYITAYKEYEVIRDCGCFYWIKDDDGYRLSVALPGEICSHLNDEGSWEIIE